MAFTMYVQDVQKHPCQIKVQMGNQLVRFSPAKRLNNILTENEISQNLSESMPKYVHEQFCNYITEKDL